MAGQPGSPSAAAPPSAARLALGTAQWGMHYGIANVTGRPVRDEVAAILRTAQRAGIDTLDTARAYGAAEAMVGSTAGAEWRVVTKLAPDVAQPGDDAAVVRGRALDSLAASRAQLRRATLDAVLLHRPEHLRLAAGAAWQTLREERAAGRIGRIGVSVVDVADADGLLDQPEVELIQVPASLVDRRLARAGFFERAAAAGREVFVRSIFLQGVAHLPAAQLPAALRALEPALATLDRAATSLGLGRATLFVAWARHALPGTRLVIGTETEAQLAANLADWEAAAGLAAEVAGLAAALPELDASVLDPWRWPSAAG